MYHGKHSWILFRKLRKYGSVKLCPERWCAAICEKWFGDESTEYRCTSMFYGDGAESTKLSSIPVHTFLADGSRREGETFYNMTGKVMRDHAGTAVNVFITYNCSLLSSAVVSRLFPTSVKLSVKIRPYSNPSKLERLEATRLTQHNLT